MKRLTGLLVITALVLALAAGCGPRATAPATTAPAHTDTAASAGTAAPTPGAQAQESWSGDEAAIAEFAKDLMSVPQKDFTLTDLNGRQWKLSDLKGKVVLLNFWATWCGPCLMEMPGFQKLHERFGDDGELVVLTVASAALEREKPEAAKAAVSELVVEQGFTFPVLFDADGTVWGIYQQEGIPANYIIDKQGNIRYIRTGAFTSEEEMTAALEAVRRADSGK